MRAGAVALAVKVSLTLGALAIATHAHGTPTRITEDDPRWNCTTMGNRICGPNNANGVTAGCYSDTGSAPVHLWPCHVVVNPDGSSDVWEGLK